MSDPNGGYNNGLNLATAEDQQRSYHQILMGIEQSWNPQGWQHEIEAGERARAIIQIAVAVKDFRVGMDQDQAVYISTAFERSVYEKGTSSSEYRDACRNKLAQIQDSRRRQIAKEEGEWRNQNSEQQQHQGMQQQQGFSPQQLQYSSPLGLSQPQFTQQQQEQYQQQQRHHQQQLLQQQQQQMQQQQQIQLQQHYNQQRQLLQQQQAQQQAHAQQQAQQQQQQQQQQQHQQQQPQYQQQQPQQPVFQLSQQQQIERNQIIQEYMNSVAQKMGSPMLHDINQNPTQDIRDLATAWGMAPAQAFLRQQAVMLYRQRVMQQQQQQQQLQMQAQGMNGQNGYSNQ